MDKFYIAVPNNNIAKAVNFPSSGWYRIAKYSPESTENNVEGSNGCDIMIKSRYPEADYSESYDLKLLVGGRSSILLLNGSVSNEGTSQLITKIRHTVQTQKDSSGAELGVASYLEVYLSPEFAGDVTQNDVYVIINNGADKFHYWEPITPELTEETIEGISVYSDVTLPANSKGTATFDENGLKIHERYFKYDSLVIIDVSDFFAKIPNDLVAEGAIFKRGNIIIGNVFLKGKGADELESQEIIKSYLSAENPFSDIIFNIRSDYSPVANVTPIDVSAWDPGVPRAPMHGYITSMGKTTANPITIQVYHNLDYFNVTMIGIFFNYICY